MKLKKVMAMLMATTMLFSLTACGEKPAANDGGEQATGVDENQYINTYLDAEPTTLDPSLRSDTYSSYILTNVLDGLIRIEQRDGEYKVMPGDAESWSTNDDQTVWTFKLGADRKWSDGQAVTAEQYVYSLQRSADPKTGCPNSYFLLPILNYDAISKGEMPITDLGVKALDATTLEITLKAAMPTFLESCNGSIFFPQRQDLIEQHGEKYGTDANTMVYNGPFKLTEWVHNSSLLLEKNDQYWDKDNVDLQKVNYQIISDVAAIANAFESGQIDFISAASAEYLDKFKADSNLKYTPSSGGTITFAFYNTENELFSNLNVRKAFTLAVDQVDVNEMAFSNLREPLYGWIAPALSVDGTSMRSVAGDTLKTQREELLASGKTPKDILIEGMKELGLGEDPATLDVTFSLAGTTDWYRTFGEYLQQMYKTELGLEIKIDFSEWSIFSSNLENSNYQIGFMSWGAYFNDPYDMLSVNLSDSNQLYTNWKNEEYDKLVKDAVTETDPEKRMQAYVDAENILMNNYVATPFATSVKHTFSKSYVHDKYAEYGEDVLYFIQSGWKNVYTSGR